MHSSNVVMLARACLLFVIGIPALPSSVAFADDTTCANQESTGLAELPASIVIPQLGPSCYGVPGENHPLTKDVRALIDKDSTSERVTLALHMLAKHVLESDVYGSRELRSSYALSAKAAAVDVAQDVPSGQGNTSPIRWNFAEGQVAAVPGLNLIANLNVGCPSPGDVTLESCQNAIETAKAWLRAAQLADAALSRYAFTYIDSLLARSTQRIAMWHAYRDEALPQFPWEWLVNSWRLNRSDTRLRDAQDQPIGPIDVPTDQLVVLHPGIGLEYRDTPDEIPAAGTQEESHTVPIVYLELLGRYRWSWDETTGKMIGGNGVSLVATYGDRDNDTDVGYGLLFHFRATKAYTLGITRSGDATNVIFNVDLADFFKDKLSYWKDIEERIDDLEASLAN
jgi:hypothetical protein